MVTHTYNTTFKAHINIMKDINLIKQALFYVLDNDMTLRGLLGGSGKIFHQSPPQDVKYPCITYECTDIDNPYDQNDDSGEITRTLAIITVFSISTGTTESDNIEAQTKKLLHGKNHSLTNSSIICYSCYRTGMSNQRLDPVSHVWVTNSGYRIHWATK